MRHEEDAVAPLPDPPGRGGVEEVQRGEGGDAGEDDGGEEALPPDADLEEEDVVEDDVGDDEGVDDAAEDAVEAVDGLVGRPEGAGVGVDGLEGQDVLDGQLGDGNQAEAFGKVQKVWAVLV